MKSKISIVLPVKNEAIGLSGLIESLLTYGEEIIVVDGHSTDNTKEIVKKHPQARFVLDNGRGKGDGLRVGIREAKHEIIVFIDADGSHDPTDIPDLVKPILEGSSDMVIGSRAKGGSDEFKMDIENLIRQVGSDFATTIVNYRWKTDLTDIQNGFRALKTSVARDLNLNANDFDIEEEMVMKALRKKYIISEIKSHEYARQWDVSKLKTSKSWKFIYRILIEVIRL
jgi:dolichol-phosphate mannosyltransferase